MVYPGDDETMVSRSSQLTAREEDVLAASATGLVVAEVAETLGLTPEDVRNALQSTIRKLEARSKLEAVLIALRHGLIGVA